MACQQTSRTILVSGANRGIGWGIVRRLAKLHESSFINQQKPLPLKIYLGSRDMDKGNEAMQKLKAELNQDELKRTTFEVCQLDVNDPKSHASVVKLLKDKEGGLDTLINNAGIALNGFDADVVRKTFATNYYGVLELNEAVLPVLRPEGRIVIVASMAGQLSGYSDDIVKRFRAVSTASEATTLAKEYQAAVDKGNHEAQGWKSAAYSVSKACIIAWARGKTNDLKSSGHQPVSIVTCCPGYVNTDMTKGKGVLTLDEGASTPVMLALEDLKGKSGGYYKDLAERQW